MPPIRDSNPHLAMRVCGALHAPPVHQAFRPASGEQVSAEHDAGPISSKPPLSGSSGVSTASATDAEGQAQRVACTEAKRGGAGALKSGPESGTADSDLRRAIVSGYVWERATN